MNMPSNPNDFNSLVSPSLKTNSRIIADRFEKEHRNVLRDIRSLIDANPEWGMHNFEQAPYVDPQNGQTYHMYEMTRDGYTMLVMGFTGQKAMEWKIKFLEAFKAMEAQTVARALPDFSNPVAAARAWADAFEREQAAKTRMIETQRIVADLTPKAEAYDILDAAEGSVPVRIAAKMLGMQERKFTKWLEVNRWAFRQNGVGTLQGYVEKRNAGYLEHKTLTFKGRDGEDRIGAQMMITAKGMARLAQIFSKEGEAS